MRISPNALPGAVAEMESVGYEVKARQGVKDPSCSELGKGAIFLVPGHNEGRVRDSATPIGQAFGLVL